MFGEPGIHGGERLLRYGRGPDLRACERSGIMGVLRTGLAGLGAWKLGGGCFSTIIIFIFLLWLLKQLGMQ